MKPTARYASLNRYIELSQSLGIDPVSGADIAAFVADVSRTPPSIAARAAAILGVRK